MLFVTDFIQLVEPVSYQESCLKVWRHQNSRIIHTVKYADDIVLLVKEEWWYRASVTDYLKLEDIMEWKW